MKDLKKKTVAAFDFDGTISYRDTFLPFLLFTNKRLKVICNIALEIPYLLGFLLGAVSRQKAKERLIKRFFKGSSIEELKLFGEKFAMTSMLPLVRPEALKRIEWHKNQGHTCVLISASLDIYLAPWAKSVGFDKVLTSTLDTNSKGEVIGTLLGLNCWGPEKVRRLQDEFGEKKTYILYAYGDSRGDKELLKIADQAFYKTMGF